MTTRVRSARHVHAVRPDTGELVCGRRVVQVNDAPMQPITCGLCQRNLDAWRRPSGYQDLFGLWWIGPPWDRERTKKPTAHAIDRGSR